MPYFVVKPGQVRGARGRLGFSWPWESDPAASADAGFATDEQAGLTATAAAGGADVTGLLVSLGSKLLQAGVQAGSAAWQAQMAKQVASFTADQQKQVLAQKSKLESLFAQQAAATGQAPVGPTVPASSGPSLGLILGGIGGGLVLLKLLKVI